MAFCSCSSPQPFPDLKSGGFFCGRCRLTVEPVTNGMNEQYTHIVGVEGVNPRFSPSPWLCPDCERLGLYFRDTDPRDREVMCILCNFKATKQVVIDIQEKIQEAIDIKYCNPMMRTLDMVTGAHAQVGLKKDTA